MEKSKSRLLFDILDKIGASENLRQLYKETARHNDILYDIGFNHREGGAYILGSMSEGTTTPGLKSDLDVVTCGIIPVVLNHEDTRNLELAALLTQNEDTPPGYAKLQAIISINHQFYQFRQQFEKFQYITRDNQGVFYWTNVFNLYKEDIYFSQEVHGPATTIFHSLVEPMDNVFCLECKQWPSFAKEWLLRERRHGCPNKGIIEQCEELGFFVVKIGHPYSKEKDFEWRVSFSLQERLLMFNFTEVQHKTYILLKLIKLDLIQRKIGKSITSYHCKTCMMYVIEQNPSSLWYPENIFECVTMCLKQLLFWARKGHCPNYFIPEENMFDGKVTGDVRIKVIGVLEKLLFEGESVFGRIKTDNFGQYLMHRDDKNIIEELEKETFQPLFRTIFKIHMTKICSVFESVSGLLNSKICQTKGNPPSILSKSWEEVMRAIEDIVSNQLYSQRLRNQLTIGNQSLEELLRAVVDHQKRFNCLKSQGQRNKLTLGIKYREKLLCAIEDHQELFDWLSSIEHIAQYTTDEIRDVIDPLFPFLHTSLACHLLSYALNSEDISTRNRYLNLSEKEFQKGMSSDVASGRLKYITYLYKLGKYELCEKELRLLEQQFKPFIHQVSPFKTRGEINHDLLRELQKHSFTAKYILQHFISAHVIFLPTELEIIPSALQFEMFRSTGTSPETIIQCRDYWYNWVVVDSEVYMYLLWYLLVRAMNAPLEQRMIRIRKLKCSVDKEPLHAETACNIYAWVCSLENCFSQAIQYLVLSWNKLRIKDDAENYKTNYKEHWQLPHNAAKWHMLLILKQVWFSQKSSYNVHNFVSFCFKCLYCLKLRFKRCSSCKMAKYCSVNCQKMDWKIHKQVCIQIRTINATR